ncbi:bifunctional acetate--CoA ligase family protein/GNAT family N-acetyltransferase [Rhizobiaceae bacterium BDR2-2]|uniref:Bifunctional acetate--CoA ligase family protein/GNAT family N-acetyltransferase n=1 Tax=Ectorhizobium quercum TaxID=2965071 RepID=A0AAE3N0G7_9HYPH|nr:bifunctional acetate--CoA ligase family protein/GNAT family N-acetyltransferase [Ectorhizobium quercum]MCX8997454.1 bifunctional acetate--CoA ligase family protein/GNAT family N-acetyltransferase [Ectorhizobium quercum]
MTIRNLIHAFEPKSVAVIGVSGRQGSVGRIVLDNIVNGGFEGDIWPVNPKYAELDGRRCYASINDIPGIPDLAIIMTPAETVPGLIGELGEKGTRAAVVITAGLTRENGLRQAMLDVAKPYLLRIVGPNTIGFMLPPRKLNASFAHMDAARGDIALLSQSGAIVTSLIDWAGANGVGFSQIVSLGDMADVDVADCLDMLAGDPGSRAIVMYLESVPNPRKFMSAARAAARVKPVIAIKPGRHAEAAKAAATHTGALSGADRVVDAALRRAGILRVNDLAELFDATETIARFSPLERARVGIVTNGGGAGVLAVDRLMDVGGELAELSAATMAVLDAALPANWSHANPVDIIGDAPPARYRAAVEAVAADPGVDVLLVMNCPTGVVSSSEAAATVASLAREGRIGGKPVLTCWLGEQTAREGRRLLQAAGIPGYETPAAAAVAVSYLTDWSRVRKTLERVPSGTGEEIAVDRAAALAVFRQVAAENRRMLTEPEAKAVARAYGIPVPETVVARSPDAVEQAAAHLLKASQTVAVKLLSKTVTHKSDVGGVVLDIVTAEAAGEAARAIEGRVPAADIEGFAVQPMIRRKQAQELILGLSQDAIFGPVLLFGAGGVAVEVMDDTAIALPPLDDVLAGDLIDRTRVGRLLAGFRDRKPVDRAGICGALKGLSQLVVDFPCVVAADINPLLADSDGVIALDARIEIDPQAVERAAPNPVLAIRPYPAGWACDAAVGGRTYHLRPIRPADAALYPGFLARTSGEDLRRRFFDPDNAYSDALLPRLTQIDYAREMAFVVLDKEEGALCGIARLSADPDHEAADIALIVRSDLQGHGLGRAMLDRLIDYARADGLKRLEGRFPAGNAKMRGLCEAAGFRRVGEPVEAGLVRVSLAVA